MYLFQISNYDDPAVDRETAELLHQHLEAESRRRCPAMWNAIDRIRTHAAKGPAREKRTVRCCIYGVFLLALGLLTLILGLMPPKTTAGIIVGGAVIIAGLLECALARGRTPPRIPASCKADAGADSTAGGWAGPPRPPRHRAVRRAGCGNHRREQRYPPLPPPQCAPDARLLPDVRRFGRPPKAAYPKRSCCG